MKPGTTTFALLLISRRLGQDQDQGQCRMRGNSTELVGSTSRPMHVIEAAIYRGPHLFSATPMIRVQLDLGELESWPTDRLPGFRDRLLACCRAWASMSAHWGTRAGSASGCMRAPGSAMSPNT